MDQERLEQFRNQGLLAIVQADTTGEIEVAEGDDAEVLGAIVAYLAEVTRLIGDSFGLEDASEVEILGKQTATVYIRLEDGLLGALIEGKRFPPAMIQSLREAASR